ncbi:MAG: fumarylacetoacetate hydrolase family protein [Planctomycetota bacterium]
MKFFSFRHGSFRRIGAIGTLGGVERRLDFTVGWGRYVADTRHSLPSFPDMDELLISGLFTPQMIGMVLAHLDSLPARDLDEMSLRGDVKFDVPVKRPGQIIAIAKNYAAHAAEMGSEPPPEPRFFSKLPSSLLPCDGEIVLPNDWPGDVHHEAELAVIIGKKAKRLAAATAREVIAGYTIINDVSHRGLQNIDKAAGMPWTRSKSIDTFCPCGPYVVSPMHFGDDRDAAIRCRVNDELRQDGNTSQMVFDVGALLAAITQYCTLHPGDIVATGTPAGVGPLRAGDTVVVEVERIGELRNAVRAG